jgi:Zn-dependent protease with chaperone function
MTFLLRCLVLALAAFGVAALVCTLLMALMWARRVWFAGTRATSSEMAPAYRADALLRLRLAPVIAATLSGVFAAVGLWRFESRETDEVIGWVLRTSAVCGTLYLGAFAARAWQMARETRRLLDAWLAGATPLALPGVTIPAFRIETHFPVVAVVGIFRPTLVVDASVLDACTPNELAAILAHEHGHLRRWDNLRRALFTATPDLLSATPISRTMRDAWREATEEAADDVAAEGGAEARVHLAAALVRVARLAPANGARAIAACHGAQLPASALYRGESVERRVRRLCGVPAPVAAPRPRWGLTLCTTVVALAFALQQRIHDTIELVVAVLP